MGSVANVAPNCANSFSPSSLVDELVRESERERGRGAREKQSLRGSAALVCEYKQQNNQHLLPASHLSDHFTSSTLIVVVVNLRSLPFFTLLQVTFCSAYFRFVSIRYYNFSLRGEILARSSSQGQSLRPPALRSNTDVAAD